MGWAQYGLNIPESAAFKGILNTEIPRWYAAKIADGILPAAVSQKTNIDSSSASRLNSSITNYLGSTLYQSDQDSLV